MASGPRCSIARDSSAMMLGGTGTWIWDMVTGFVDDYVIGPVLDVLGIHSPS